MAQRKPQVNVAIEQETKERWEQEVAENPKYATMSDLIRMSVERELSKDDTRDTQVGGKQVAKLSEQVESLESAIQGLSGDFSELKGIIESQSPNTQNLKSEVFAALPESKEGVYNYATPQEIASKIGGPVDTDTVSNVLDDLAENTGQVTQGFEERDGERVILYAKRGDKI